MRAPWKTSSSSSEDDVAILIQIKLCQLSCSKIWLYIDNKIPMSKTHLHLATQVFIDSIYCDVRMSMLHSI